MKPTQKHQPVIWEGILGTVYAASPAGEVRYFDYKWDDARAFAGIGPDSDLRIGRISQISPHGIAYYGGKGPSHRQWALWAVR